MSTLRIIFCFEAMALMVGMAIGLWGSKNRLMNIAISIVGCIGLILVMKNILFGLNSDAEIIFPFAGELFLVCAVTAFITRLCKRLYGKIRVR